VDSPELQQVKGLIRRTEARAAAIFSGVKEDNVHFLDMPFYETGRVRKAPLSEADVRIIMDLLERVKPHQVYAAGDLSDPHGTHRVCLAAIFEALRRLKADDWMKTCEVWLYRGAWQEWGIEEIEMAVPLSPDEVMRKRTGPSSPAPATRASSGNAPKTATATRRRCTTSSASRNTKPSKASCAGKASTIPTAGMRSSPRSSAAREATGRRQPPDASRGTACRTATAIDLTFPRIFGILEHAHSRSPPYVRVCHSG
jgi:LmbE family N-acetylglucosaminyl deacetylase